MKRVLNFLNPKSIFRPSKNRRKKILYSCVGVLGGLLTIFVVLAAMYWGPAHRLMKDGTSGKDAFFKAQDLLLAQDFSGAQTTLEGAVSDFTSAQETFKKFLWLKKIPWVKNQVVALENVLAAGVTTGQSIHKVAAVASSIAQPLTKSKNVSLSALSTKEKSQILESIYNAKPALEDAKRSIDQAVNFVNAIPSDGLLKKIQDVTDPLKEKVPKLQAGLDDAIIVSRVLPVVAGHPALKKYLFLLQNNAELAPSGGFIGTYGILKVKDGEIASFVTDNVYNLDGPAEAWLNIPAPWPVARYNAAPKLFLRGASWSPDFPTTGERAQWFYKAERGPEKNLDGTIAITPTFIESLLTLTGEVTVNGLKFTPENFTEVLQDQVERRFVQQGIAPSKRKEIIGVLSEKILNDVLALPKNRWPDLWKIVQKNIQEKQIILYMNDEYTQSLILKENFGGEMKDVNHDYVAVIDANLASLKSDPVVKRSLRYSVQRDGDDLVADLQFTYKNEGTITWKTTRYRTYVRTYVPEGSTLLSAEGPMIDCKVKKPGQVETTQELKKTVFGAFVCTEPGESKTLHLRYKLPNRISDQVHQQRYQLLVQKQAGTAPIPVTLTLDVKRQITAATGFLKAVELGKDTLSQTETLSQDLQFDLQLE